MVFRVEVVRQHYNLDFLLSQKSDSQGANPNFLYITVIFTLYCPAPKNCKAAIDRASTPVFNVGWITGANCDE